MLLVGASGRSYCFVALVDLKSIGKLPHVCVAFDIKSSLSHVGRASILRLFYQNAIGLFNASNPSGDVTEHVLWISILVSALLFGASVSLKRLWYVQTLSVFFAGLPCILILAV